MRLIDADELKKLFPDHGEGSWTYNITAKSYIDNAPTVDPYDICKGVITGNYALGFHLGWEKAKERPQGEWIIEKETTFEFYMKCSNCDAPAEWLDGESQFLSNFCPNCGADMRGDKE